MAKKAKLPEGYGEGAAAPAKKGGAAKLSYIKFVTACRKTGKSMKQCAVLWKAEKAKGGAVYAKGRRKRAARIVRRKRKAKAPAEVV